MTLNICTTIHTLNHIYTMNTTLHEELTWSFIHQHNQENFQEGKERRKTSQTCCEITNWLNFQF